MSNTCDMINQADNLVWSGTLILEGDGLGIVYNTGDNTLIGHIASLALKDTGQFTNAKLDYLTNSVAIVVLIICLGLFSR